MEIPVYEDVETKPVLRGNRMLRSEAARSRRRKAKQVIETRVTNEWAKVHRMKKKKKNG